MAHQGSGHHQSGYDTIQPSHTNIHIGNGHRDLFSSKEIRSNFVSKVYSILVIQLVAASALIAWFTFHEPTKQYMKYAGQYYYYGAFALFFVSYMILVCVSSARRSFPMNLILLALITLSYGLVAAVISSQFETKTVLCAFGATALSTFVLILLAKFSPFDMTTCGCGLCILALIHTVVSTILIIALVPTYASASAMIIAGSGAFLVSLYMVFDLQLIMGGRSVELSPEEYIMGAVLLYLDILMLFQYLLILFAKD